MILSSVLLRHASAYRNPGVDRSRRHSQGGSSLMGGAYLKSLEEDDEASKLNEPDEERSAVSRPPAHLRKSHKLKHRPPFDCIALLLQGGGALGAYQAGVYEALAEADLR